MKFIRYSSGYKYQLEEDFDIQTSITPVTPGGNRFVSMSLSGVLHVSAGYAWDGPSGPTLDTTDFMRGSLVHDALYQLMQEGILSKDFHRKAADQLLRKICLEDGMPAIRAWWVYQGVRFAGGQYTRYNKKVIRTAPERHDYTAF